MKTVAKDSRLIDFIPAQRVRVAQRRSSIVGPGGKGRSPHNPETTAASAALPPVHHARKFSSGTYNAFSASVLSVLSVLLGRIHGVAKARRRTTRWTIVVRRVAQSRHRQSADAGTISPSPFEQNSRLRGYRLAKEDPMHRKLSYQLGTLREGRRDAEGVSGGD